MEIPPNRYTQMNREMVRIISKKDAITDQLCNSIVLFFGKRYLLSAHTLAEASCELLNGLGAPKGIQGHRKNTNLIPADQIKIWRNKNYALRNFLKHADSDPEQTIEYNIEKTAFVLIEAVILYISIYKKWMLHTLLFAAWFISQYPRLISTDSEQHKLVISAIKQGTQDGSLSMESIYSNLTSMDSLIESAPEINPETWLHIVNLAVRSVNERTQLRPVRSAIY